MFGDGSPERRPLVAGKSVKKTRNKLLSAAYIQTSRLEHLRPILAEADRTAYHEACADALRELVRIIGKMRHFVRSRRRIRTATRIFIHALKRLRRDQCRVQKAFKKEERYKRWTSKGDPNMLKRKIVPGEERRANKQWIRGALRELGSPIHRQ